MSDLNRRTALTTIATLPALAVPAAAIAAATPDPIFAAIEVHRAAYATAIAACGVNCALEDEVPRDKRKTMIDKYEEKIVETDDPRWIASEKATMAGWKALWEADGVLLDVEPTTIAGVAALLRYAYEHEKKNDADETVWETGYQDGDDELSWSCYLHKHLAAALDNIVVQP